MNESYCTTEQNRARAFSGLVPDLVIFRVNPFPSMGLTEIVTFIVNGILKAGLNLKSVL